MDEIHENHKNGSVPPHNCPVCKMNGRWRSGVHFDNQKICLNKTHPVVVWTPDIVRSYRDDLTKEQFGDGVGI